MTCIVSPSRFQSKAKLLENIKAGKVWIEDPSIFAPRSFNAWDMRMGQKEVVTNHPLRTKFATIKRIGEGPNDFKVE